MLGAAFLLVGAGAATVAAVDTTGNNIALNGSDTLFDVTQDVIAACKIQFGDFTAQNISYLGGGSGVGAAQMGLNAQQEAPMSRALKNTEYCSIAAPAGAGLAEDIMVGIDGISIVANTVNSCADATATAPTFGKGTFAVTDWSYLNPTTFAVNIAPIAGPPPSCPGCDVSSNYTISDSFDALSVLYFGLHHPDHCTGTPTAGGNACNTNLDKTSCVADVGCSWVGTYDCNSPVRKTLVRQWTNLFQADCAAGDTTCAAGLTHAWRRSDLSGTTDAFVSVLNPPGRGIGTLPNVPVGAGTKVNPFCNSTDATSGTGSFGGSADFSDNDPIRTPCGLSGAAAANDNVCGFNGLKKGDGSATGGNFQGDLGIVLPVLMPDGPQVTQADFYPAANTACTNSCVLVAPIKGSQLPNGYRCVDGTLPIGGACLMPAVSGDPRCVAGTHSQCAGAAGHPDGRRYNLVVTVVATQVPVAQRGTTPFQFAQDANSVASNRRFLTGAFYRDHEFLAGAHNVPVTGTTGQCRENDDTSQIGCMVDSDPCSVGYAGREASKLYPGNPPGTPVAAQLKSFAVSGSGLPATTPFPDSNISNLLLASGTLYPLDRRLYLGTIYGFGNLINGERELERCYTNNDTVTTAVGKHGFVAVPGGVQCLDYPEELGTNTTPAPNTRGAGNVALGGCALGLTGHNACTDPATAPDICGDGVKTAVEGCDDGNLTDGDGCDHTCTVEAGFTCTGTNPSVCTP
jgi:cysteine-rich repeat protein